MDRVWNGGGVRRGAERAVAGTPIGRRIVLAMAGLGVAGIALGAAVQRRVGDALAKISPNNPLLNLLPGADQFRIYTIAGFPQVSAAAYRLRISGLVDRPRTLTYADLRAMRPVHLTKDFQCVTGWRVPNVHWTGVRLGDVLDAAGVQQGATAVLFSSFDGVYTESLTLDQARRPDVIVAYEMLGGPITTEHGGPVRLYVAPMYGYKSCKWLGGIQVADHVVPGYWENDGYDVDAWIGQSNGRDDTPIDGR